MMKKGDTQLGQIQLWMQSLLVKPVANDSAKDIETYISVSANLTAQECLGIYQNSYELRLLECMRKQFTALCFTLGDQLFNEFSLLYLRSKPSGSPSLSELGYDFPQFLEETRPDKDAPESWIAFMIAMAQFEIDLYQIFDQKGSEGEKFATDKTEDKYLKLQAGFGLRQYPFDVHHYYKQVSLDQNPHISEEKNTYIVFYRKAYKVFVLSLTKNQYAFLLKLQQNSKN